MFRSGKHDLKLMSVYAAILPTAKLTGSSGGVKSLRRSKIVTQVPQEQPEIPQETKLALQRPD